MLSRVALAARSSIRRAPVRKMGHYVDPKNPKAVWLSDAGAYPVLIVCGFAGALCTYWNYRLLTSQPRIAWTKTRRGNLMKEEVEAATSYYNHPLRELGKKKHRSYMAKIEQ